jgi:hypothetical protein
VKEENLLAGVCAEFIVGRSAVLVSKTNEILGMAEVVRIIVLEEVGTGGLVIAVLDTKGGGVAY